MTILNSVACFVIGFLVAWWLRSMRMKSDRDQPTAHETTTDVRVTSQELTAAVHEARTDMLTGLKNRRAFQEELHRLFAQRQRQGILFSLVLFDIDHFKVLNDTHGHLAGDAILQAVAKVLSSTLREMDFLCRFGGDEFAVICPGSRVFEAAVAAERARQAVRTMAILNPAGVRVLISAGVAEVGNAEIAEGLMHRTDEALYAAKNAGRDRVHLHDGHGCIPARVSH